MASDKLPIWLAWNLFLAAVPLIGSAAFRSAIARKRSVLAAASFILWLLFLPNAHYILTDLIHLAPPAGVPLWYNLALIVSCAGTGALLGYLSLIDVQNVIERKVNNMTGWAVVIVSLILSAFGIYLGRYLRWNSWNAFTNPIQLLKAVIGIFIDSGSRPHPLPVTLVFGGGMIIGYLALRIVAASVTLPQPPDTACGEQEGITST